MRISLLILIGFLAAGCETLSQKDASILRDHNVPAPLQQKMVRHDSLPPVDVVELSRRHVPAPLIVNYLESTGTVYALKTRDVLALRRDGVSEEVLDFMLQTPSYSAPVPFADPYFFYGPPVVIVRHR